ncbi:MAG: SpoIIE family protein phosphatase [Acidobacteriota bacterium]
MERRPNLTPLLLLLGLISLGLAGLSIADMFVPRAYDGVLIDVSRENSVMVREVVPGSGADRAKIRRGEEIVGIGREALRDHRHAAKVLSRYRIGEKVLYLVRSPGEGVREVEVKLGRKRIGDGPYYLICLLGFAFFFVGLFALVRQPGLLASQVFFLVGCLFLLFLVCRMRPASYSGVDGWIHGIGTLALVLLPPAFLHFYVLFPRPAWLEQMSAEGRMRPVVWLFKRGWPLLYAAPLVIFALSWAVASISPSRGDWFSGAPVLNWWLLAAFLLLGLLALGANGRRLAGARERRGVTLVLLGSLFGLLPFAISSLVLPAYAQSRLFLLYGLMPLALVPITFAYAIVRFQLLDIRIILRRSLLYTVTTALVTGVYAGGIATFNAFFRGSELAATGYFPIVLALAIVLLFDPVRRRVQELIDRAFFAGRSRLQRAMEELGEAMTAQRDLQAAVGDLVERLPQIVGFRFAALYLQRGQRLERIAGPEDLPIALPILPELQRALERRRGLVRLDQLGALPLRSADVAQLVGQLSAQGVEVIADLASRGRPLGLMLFSERVEQAPLEDEEIDLLERLLDQSSLALETGLLLEERTQKAELEREMEIAASIQAELLSQAVHLGEGWQVAAECLPARIVGGDFFAQMPSEGAGGAIVYGDVSGKSVSGAMMMMAAHEALYSLGMAMGNVDPEKLFDLANRRIYGLGKRSFVALGLLLTDGTSCRLRYLIAGQPPPLLRRITGEVVELPLAEHRVPVGAMPRGGYQSLTLDVEPGEIVLAYSDGVTDARSPDGEFFGEERLQRILEERQWSPAELVHAARQAVESFTRGGLLYDDVTLLAISCDDPGEETDK